MNEAVAAWLLWSALGVVVYTYVGYPLVLALLRDIRREPDSVSPWPTVTVVVAAYNEAAAIAEKVRNALEHDYPAELDVIVVSDGSTDATAAIMHRCDSERVRFLAQPERRGKNAALNRGVAAASGEIVVFTDADALLAPGALRRLIAPFGDPVVGLVSGQGTYGQRDRSTAQIVSSTYVRYESFLKRRESALGFIAAADGALYAMRRALYRELPLDQVHDLVHPIEMALSGFRSVFVPDAYTVEPPSEDAKSEYERHLRISTQGYLVFFRHAPRLLAGGRLKEFWILLSHRFLRWTSGIFLLTALATNALLVTAASWYVVLLTAQLIFYGFAVGGCIAEPWGIRLRVFSLPYFFCVISAAGAAGFVRFMRGHDQAVWESRQAAR